MVDLLSTDDQDANAAEEECRQRQIELNQGAIALLDSWLNVSEEEIQEQIETWKYLRQALDENRPSHAKLFPKDKYPV